MLELMLSGTNVWRPPAADANTLFRLVDFNSAADIVDRSPNKIAVTNNGGITVGSDKISTYMLFNAAKWLSFTSSLLNRTNVELTWVLGDILKVTSQYAGPLLDTRPVGSNGNYHILSINQNAAAPPYKLSYNYPSNTSVSFDTTLGVSKYPSVVKLRIMSTGAEVLVDGKVVYTSSVASVLNTASLKIGRSAFASAGVPELYLKMYFFEIKAIPV
jgi:hypothetical protein